MTGERLDAHLSALQGGLMARANRLANLDRAFHLWAMHLGPWARHVHVANVEGERVALYSASAAALTPLRYRQQEVLDWFRAQTGLDLRQIKVSVQPPASLR